MPSSKKAGVSPIKEEAPASLSIKDIFIFMQNKGVCSTLFKEGSADLFFVKKNAEMAKLCCNICPAKPYCLILAIENQEEYGVWGGLDEDERRDLKKAS